MQSSMFNGYNWNLYARCANLCMMRVLLPADSALNQQKDFRHAAFHSYGSGSMKGFGHLGMSAGVAGMSSAPPRGDPAAPFGYCCGRLFVPCKSPDTLILSSAKSLLYSVLGGFVVQSGP